MKSKKKLTRREKLLLRRLDKQKAQIKNLQCRLKKETVKRDCYHDPVHRYETHRVKGRHHFKVIKCGYCGLELVANEISAKEASRLAGVVYHTGSVGSAIERAFG